MLAARKRWPVGQIPGSALSARTPEIPRWDSYLAVESSPLPDSDVANVGAGRLLRGDGNAGRDVVLDRQVVALKREAHAILG